jgi:hypothetical protein
MRLVGRYGLVWARLAAAGFLLTGAAACAGVAAAPATVPTGSARPAATAPAGGSLDGQPAFVTAGTAVDGTRHPARASSPTASSGGGATTVTTGGTTLSAGNPDGHATVPAAGLAVATSDPAHVIGDGSPAGCTSAAVVQAVAEGGVITFNCGPRPVTITMTATAKVVNTSHQVVLDGGGKVTLSGGGDTRILYMNTCDPAQTYTTSDCWEQQWPQLVVQNMTFTDAYSATQEANGASYGGGAIFDEGGQLKVVNSVFTGDQCYASGPDLGGGAIRATGMYMQIPVYITNDTFTGNSCSNGAALSGLYANFAVYNSLMTDNKAIGSGANPAASGTAGGGSGGAIYTDGNGYNLIVDGSVMTGNTAREGGGAIFFVVDADGGTLTLDDSTLSGNSSGAFQNAPGIFDEVNSVVTQPVENGSSVS